MTTETPRRGRGQPRIGTPVMVRIPDDRLAELDAGARARGITRAVYIRQLIDLALTPPVSSSTRRRHRS